MRGVQLHDYVGRVASRLAVYQILYDWLGDNIEDAGREGELPYEFSFEFGLYMLRTGRGP